MIQIKKVYTISSEKDVRQLVQRLLRKRISITSDSQAVVGEQLGMHQSSVSRLLGAKRGTIRPYILQRVAKLNGYTLTYMYNAESGFSSASLCNICKLAININKYRRISARKSHDRRIPTNADIAKRIGISCQTVGKILNHPTTPVSFNMACRIINKLAPTDHLTVVLTKER